MLKHKNKSLFLIFGVLFAATVVFGGGREVKADCDKCVADCVEYGENQYDCTFDFCSNECGAIGSDNAGALTCAAEGGTIDPSDGKCRCAPGQDPDANGICADAATRCQVNQIKDNGGNCVCMSGYTPDSDGICVAQGNIQEANKRVANEAETKASAAVSGQQVAVNNVNTMQASQAKACASGTAQQCANASAALNKAKADLANATADAQSAIASYQNAAASLGQSSGDSSKGGSGGASFMLCANGAIAPVCTGSMGEGTPLVLGGSTYNGGGGSYSGGLSGGSSLPLGPKCGAGFSDVGGVCFPMNTGLSNAPITLILSNIFSWLMGLFTTLAVLAFVVSGVQYMMASGDESLAETAKGNAKNALIGIIVGLSGFIVVKAIAAALSGQGYFF